MPAPMRLSTESLTGVQVSGIREGRDDLAGGHQSGQADPAVGRDPHRFRSRRFRPASVWTTPMPSQHLSDQALLDEFKRWLEMANHL